ncbi:O-antigen ligase family protein [bacterium]|nr:O-antigen ligase family protein [bacterium]
MIWFVILFCFFYTLLAFKKLNWAILVLIFFLPAYLFRFSLLGIPSTLLEAMILIAFFVWFIKETNFISFLKGEYNVKKYFENKKKRIKYPFGLEIILLIIIAFVSAGVANFFNSALGLWKACFFEPILVFILILNNFKEKKDRDKIIYALALSSFFISLYAILQKFTGWGITNEFWQLKESRRVTSFFLYPNALALYLAPLIMIFLGKFWELIKSFSKTFFKRFDFLKIIFLGTTILLSLLSIYFARSEGAIIALIFGFAFFVFFLGKYWRWTLYFLTCLVLIFLIFSPIQRTWVFDKVCLKDLSGEIRKQQWRETKEVLSENKKTFFLGLGLANYQEKIKPYHQEGIFYNIDKDSLFRTKLLLFNEKYKAKYWQPVETYLYPHNIFLNFWAELGFLGMVLFAWIFFKLLAIGYKLVANKDNQQKYLSLGLASAVIVILTHGLVDVPYFKNDLAIIFWIIVALISLMNLELKNE